MSRDEDTARRIKKWYRSKRWQDMRSAQLRKCPYCQCPHHLGKGVMADDPELGGVAVVDHVDTHRGDAKKFWRSPLRTMAKQCHDRYRQSEEKGGAGFLKGCDEDGWPLDRGHPTYG